MADQREMLRQLLSGWGRLNQAVARPQNVAPPPEPGAGVGGFAAQGLPQQAPPQQRLPLSPFEYYAGMMPQQQMPTLPDPNLATNWQPESQAALMRFIKPPSDVNYAARKPRKLQGRFGDRNKRDMKGMIGGNI